MPNIPTPENYEKRMNKDKDNFPITYYKDSNGKIVQRNPMGPMKNGQYVHPHTDLIKIFGCKGCRWIETDLCPHRDNGVSRKKYHMNGYCSQRMLVPMAIDKSGFKMTMPRLLQVRGLMDAEVFSKFVQDEAMKGKRDINDVFPWEKLKADILDRIRKQDEGSKVTVEKKFTPSDLANLIDKAKEVNVEVVDNNTPYADKELDDDYHSNYYDGNGVAFPDDDDSIDDRDDPYD